ncbi:hypothetical protein JYK22_16620, partial [Nonomuraea sp. RK-328]|nr:hypothetical protein [Nonomuraea sp. RK-328]
SSPAGLAKGYLRRGYGDERLPISLEQAQKTATSMRLSAQLEELHDLHLGKIRVNEQGELVAKDGRVGH